MFRVYVDWTYGVNPLIVEYVDSLNLDDESRIEVINENEVIIHNQGAASWL